MGLANQLTSFVVRFQSSLDSTPWSRTGGFVVDQLRKFKGRKPLQVSPLALQAYRSVITEKVSLIERLPSRYRKEVATDVWLAVMKGYDEHGLARILRDRFGFAAERARSTAAAQCRMAKSVIGNASRLENGAIHAIWSSGTSCKLPGHGEFNQRPYKLHSGAQLNGKWVLPGSEPACDCSCAEAG